MKEVAENDGWLFATWLRVVRKARVNLLLTLTIAQVKTSSETRDLAPGSSRNPIPARTTVLVVNRALCVLWRGGGKTKYGYAGEDAVNLRTR